ncbi:MAG: hypothetical protein KC656_25250, partial [Myxococcales bacterium]|nr:hypothetical protein [Myxococcales bacterium]
ILTYLFATRHPGRLERIVTLDVGGHLQPGLRHLPLFLGYQGWLIAAEALGSDGMARWMAGQARAPHPERATARMGWPYRMAWRALLRRRYRKSLVRRFRPELPVLFLYGTRKPFMFHSRWWIEALEANPDCRVQAVDAGHWLMLKRPEAVEAAIRAFV